jgi:hypothetical protein
MAFTKRQVKYFKNLYKQATNKPFQVDSAQIRKQVSSPRGNVPIRAKKGGKVVKKRRKRS